MICDILELKIRGKLFITQEIVSCRTFSDLAAFLEECCRIWDTLYRIPFTEYLKEHFRKLLEYMKLALQTQNLLFGLVWNKLGVLWNPNVLLKVMPSSWSTDSTQITFWLANLMACNFATVDLERPTVALWKDLNLFNKHNFNWGD